jgi:hypothetical protein
MLQLPALFSDLLVVNPCAGDGSLIAYEVIAARAPDQASVDR